MQKEVENRIFFRTLLRRYFVIALTICILAVMLLYYTMRTEKLQNSAQNAISAPYSAGIQDGQLAIYIAGQDTPALITNIAAASLPKSDQEALQNRILLPSDEALAQLLEDYSS